MTTTEQGHPLDPSLSRRDLHIVDDLVTHALGRARAGRPPTWYDAVDYVRDHRAASTVPRPATTRPRSRSSR